jgi:hypothetical protein
LLQIGGPIAGWISESFGASAGIWLGAVLRSIEHWPQHEWSSRVLELILDRTSPHRIEEITRIAGPLLTEELARWR